MHRLVNPGASILRGLALAACLLGLAGAARGITLEELQKSFIARYDEANAKRDDQLKKLEAGYLGALERYLGKVQKGGRLEAVVPVRDEIESIRTGADPLPSLPDNAAYEFKQLRRKYVDARDAAIGEHAETLVELAGKMDAALEDQEAALTKAGRIDDALAAKRMRETLSADAGIKAARDRTSLGQGAGRLEPALQVRRSGDGLEVIVYYDAKGELSMDSPVRNTRESGENQGSTEAEVLGEFVGAKGYEVDPYVPIDLEFDGRDLGPCKFNEIETTPRVKVEGELGVGLAFKAGAKNPFVHLGHVLPKRGSGGGYRVTCRYYIPADNKALSSLHFVQEVGEPIGGRRLTHRGSWRTEKLDGEATRDSRLLLLYLSTEPGKAARDAQADRVVLASLKVEQVRFSATVHKRLGNSGDLPQAASEAEAPPVLIRNGEFVVDR